MVIDHVFSLIRVDMDNGVLSVIVKENLLSELNGQCFRCLLVMCREMRRDLQRCPAGDS
jgi:hypothetical protein